MVPPPAPPPPRRRPPPAPGATGKRRTEPAPDGKPAPAPRRLRLGLLEAAMQQVAEGVIIADREGRFVFWNAAAKNLIGADPLPVSPAEWSSVYGCFLPDAGAPSPPGQLPLARAL